MPSLEARNSLIHLAILQQREDEASKHQEDEFDLRIEQVLFGNESDHDLDTMFLEEASFGSEDEAPREEQTQDDDMKQAPQEEEESSPGSPVALNDPSNQGLATAAANMLLEMVLPQVQQQEQHQQQQAMPLETPLPRAESASILNASALLQAQQNPIQDDAHQAMETELDEDMVTKPKRQLTAYNLFFKQQRAELLQTLPAPTTKNGKRKKKPRNSHGKIGFAEMAQTISRKWKAATEEEKKEYKALAELDKQRYQSEMAVYRRTLSLISERKASRASSMNRGFVSDSVLPNNGGSNASDSAANVHWSAPQPQGVNASNNMFLAML